MSNQIDSSARILGIFEDFGEVQASLVRAETFCGELSHEFLKPQSGNFTKIDSHYTVDGLLVTYRNARDNRLYDVHITARDH